MTEWRVIPSVSDYEASEGGQIRRRAPGRFQTSNSALVQHPGNKKGYLKVALWIDGRVVQRWVNRLVCEAFHGAPPTSRHQAAHGNGNNQNNHQRNLRWATRAENYADSIRHGTSKRGEGNSSNRLTEAQVREIRARVMELPTSSGRRCRIKKGALDPVAAKYGVSAHCIRSIVGYRTWRHI